jgi:HlyD family secretion protein
MGLDVRLHARNVVALVALGLIPLAAGSAYTFWRLRPPPQPSQVIYGSGRIEADEVRVGVEIPGRLLVNRAIEGQQVTSGQLIAEIDPGDYELQADRAAAQRAAAVKTTAQVDVQIATAVHHAMIAKADLDRYEALGRRGFVSGQRLDAERATYVQTADQVSVLRQQRAAAADQALVAAKSLALAKSQMAKTQVRSPISGAVLERLAEPGEVLAAGQPVVVLADLSTVKLKVFISERDLGKVRFGAPVRVRVDAFPARDFPARVAEVDAQAQFTPRDVHMQDERSRTVYGVTLRAANPDGQLKPGMPADAWILWDAKAGWPSRLQVPQ